MVILPVSCQEKKERWASHLNLVKVAFGLAGSLHSCGQCGIVPQNQQPLFASGEVSQDRLHLQLHMS